MALIIHADGMIRSGTTILPERIIGTSPRYLARGGRKLIDVTHVWHSPRLPEIVAGLLSDDGPTLPAGFHFRERADRFPMIGVDRDAR